MYYYIYTEIRWTPRVCEAVKYKKTTGIRNKRVWSPPLPSTRYVPCVLHIYFGDSPSEQGGTCASLCSVFKGLTTLWHSVFFQ